MRWWQSRVPASASQPPSSCSRYCRATAADAPTPHVVAATDEGGSIKLVREAVEHDGTLRNLPPCVVTPLVPFVFESAGRPAATDGQGFQLRGEMVPMAPGEIAVTMHLVRAAEAAAPLVPLCFRLKAGKSAMVMRVDAGVATVLLVRCTEMTNGPVPPPTGK
jgi:hypothetical protein